MYSTQFIVPLVEETLFGEFCLQKKFFHKDMAAVIFQAKLSNTVDMLVPWFKLMKNSGRMHLNNLFYLCCKQICTCTEYFEQERWKNLQRDEETIAFAWNPSFFPKRNVLEYSVWFSVWIRVNCATAFNQNNVKLVAFINSHLDIIRYLDSLLDPCDMNLNMDWCQVQCIKTTFDMDRNYIQKSVQSQRVRKYPLEIIQHYYPKLPWYPEQITEITERDVKRIKAHHYDIKPKSWRSFQYYACLYIMVQCKELHELNEHKNPDLLDALWFYHGCFIDYMCGDSPLITAATYPHDNNVFTAYDLPNVFHILMSITMWGEKVELNYLLGNLIQKTLPYAGARRTLSEKIDDILSQDDDLFWKILAHIIYCMQSDMYPHYLSSNKRLFNLEKLCNVRSILNDRSALKQKLKNHPKSCFIIFTSFRMWILMMAHEQKHYLDVVSKFMDWEDFKQRTIEMAHIIQWDNQSKLIQDNKNAKIYRYRDNNCIETLLHIFVDTLEKTIYKEIKNWEHRDMAKYPPEIQYYVHELQKEIDTHTKTNILNLLLKTERHNWLHVTSLCIMKVHGNVSDHAIYLIEKLVHIYYNSARPKDYENVVDLFEVNDLKVVCWYFRVIASLNKIDFQLLTDKQIKDIDYAIATNKYMLFPGQTVPDIGYNVYISICCGKIKTLQGSEKFGHENIAYDIENHTYLCSKTPKKIIDYKNEEYGFAEVLKQRKIIRSQRKEFNCIPCHNNPVLTIPLRGFMLIYNKCKYLHCPSCGSFHKFAWNGYEKDSYACLECRHKQRKNYYTCHTCLVQIPEAYAKLHTLTKIDPVPLNGLNDIFQTLYYCKNHYKIEKNKHNLIK
jgi:hypothetical protein